MNSETQYIEIAGFQVFVKSWRPLLATGTPLVLLHDSLGSVALWRDFPALLAQRLGRPVIAYDRPGFGASSPCSELPQPTFVHEEAVTVFPALRQALQLDEYVLLGHSVGGAMALEIAAADPEHCRAVITEAAQAFVEERTLQGIREARDAFADPGQLDRLGRYHGDKARWVLAAWTDTWLAPEFADWSLTPVLGQVTCPVLAIHGDRDEYGSLAFPQRIVSGVGGFSEQAVLENCGHVPHREQPDVVLTRICDFLSHDAVTAA